MRSFEKLYNDASGLYKTKVNQPNLGLKDPGVRKSFRGFLFVGACRHWHRSYSVHFGAAPGFPQYSEPPHSQPYGVLCCNPWRGTVLNKERCGICDARIGRASPILIAERPFRAMARYESPGYPSPPTPLLSAIR